AVYESRPEHIAVYVAFTPQRVSADRRILAGRRDVILRHRRIVDRGDVDADGGNAAVGGAVVGLVAEAVGAVVVGIRRVGERAVGVQRQTAVHGTRDQDRTRRGAV